MPTKRTTKKKESEDEVPEKAASSVTCRELQGQGGAGTCQREELQDFRKEKATLSCSSVLTVPNPRRRSRTLTWMRTPG